MDTFWKNKKILTYIALMHHTRFIIPIMERLKQLGADVHYIVGQAERSQEITAIECGLNYKHVFEYLSEKDSDEIQKNYLREREAFSKALVEDYAMGTQLVTVLDKTLYSTAQEYTAFKNLLDVEKPDICFALHEVNRWGKMFAFWSKKLNIPFITLQEGLGYDPNFGYIGQVQYTTLDLVWGERIKKKLSDFEAPVERIIPVGNTHLSKEIERQKKDQSREKIRKKHDLNGYFVPLLLFSASPVPKDILMPLLKTVSHQSHLKMIVKFHPACKYKTYEEWKASIPEKLKKKIIFVHGSENTYDLISASDLCVLARPSTTGIEAIAFGKPLVQLDIPSKIQEVYSFVDQQVALGRTPEKLADELAVKNDFIKMFDPVTINNFLVNELTDTTGAVDRFIDIARKMISANKPGKMAPLNSTVKPLFEWSFIITVPKNSPEKFLFQLNSIAEHTDESDNFEVILIQPPDISPDTKTILDSLEGNITSIVNDKEIETYSLINSVVAMKAKGKYLVFFAELICPGENWLTEIKKGIKKYGHKKIYGAKIINPYNNIVHAGMVLNANNSPTSAYKHLDTDFPAANKERHFQMLDQFIAMERQSFLDLGGVWAPTGLYAFLDLCLRAAEFYETDDAAIYLPQVSLTSHGSPATPNIDNSIHFFSRWHGSLWNSEDKLYKEDEISRLQLDAARMTRAIETVGI